MSYPLISIRPLMDEVAGELKTLVKTSTFTEEEIYGWMVEASRLIGGASYEAANAYLTIKDHVTILPKDLYLLDKIELCTSYPEGTLPPGIYVSTGEFNRFRHIRTKILKPADSITRNLCTVDCIPVDGELTYTFKIPPGIGRFSFSRGIIYIEFQRLAKDVSGDILVSDEPNAAKALKCYAKLMLVQERYILQGLPRYIYSDLKDEWDSYRETAQRQRKYPSQADNAYYALKQDARFRKMRYKIQ